MLVTVEDQGKLKRKLSVLVPLADVQDTYSRVFAELRSHVRVPGFRPGKFPRALAEKRFQALLDREAAENLVPKYFDQALKEKELRPATEPRFQNLKIDKKQPLTFDVEFEVFPAFELLPAGAFKLEDPPIEVTEAQIGERIAQLRKESATLEDKGAAPAETGDTVTFDFEGTLDGNPFPGGSGKGQRCEVGAGQFLKDIEAQFPGMTAGQGKAFDLTFAPDFPQPSLAGKTVQFQVTVHKVEKAVPAALNGEFFARFGKIETEAQFRDSVKERLRAEAERARLSAWRHALVDQMRAQYDFDVPESAMADSLHRYEHELAETDPAALQDAQKLEQLKAERTQAIRGDMRLDFVVDTYARQHDIQVARSRLHDRFTLQALMMRRNPGELLKTSDGERMLKLLHHEMLIEKVLGHLAHVVLGKQIPPELAAGPPPEDSALEAAQGGEGQPAGEAPAGMASGPETGGQAGPAAAGQAAGQQGAEPHEGEEHRHAR